jgi:hypothetical protein
MEILVLVGIIWVAIAFLSSLDKKTPGRRASTRRPPHVSAPGTATSAHRQPDVSAPGTKRDLNVYRPSASVVGQRRPIIAFNEESAESGPTTDLDIKDLVDALTGAPLHLDGELYQCQRCKVFYQAQSYEVIRTENGGRCVSCLQAELVIVTGRREQRGRNADVGVITLANFREYVGHVITFEGHVKNVLTSRRGTDYAVMFEDRSWTQGFKMVAFKGSVSRIGGEQFLYSLADRHVTVRGLLIHHEQFGYEIIISDRAMVLSIQ